MLMLEKEYIQIAKKKLFEEEQERTDSIKLFDMRCKEFHEKLANNASVVVHSQKIHLYHMPNSIRFMTM